MSNGLVRAFETPETPDTPGAPAADAEYWILRLYIAGQSPRSLRALANLRRICADDVDARYRLEVIDLHQQPELAQCDQIVALPALIKRLPEPLRSIVGDMSSTERVLVGLDLLPRSPRLPITPPTAP